MNILIAEDNEMNQQLMARYMIKLGWEYSLSDNGVMAIEEFKTSVFNAVLMDIDMPVMNGIEAAMKIRKLNSTVPIIAITAYSDENMRAQCAGAGMNAFLAKPCSIDDIKEVIIDCVAISAFGK